MAIFQFAFVLEAQMGLTNAVREAARRAAATTASDPTTLQNWTVSQLTGGSGLLASNVQGFSAGRMETGSPAATVCAYTVDGLNGQKISVSATYGYPIFFPLLDFALPGNAGGSWPLSASAEMRLETPFASGVGGC